MYNTIYPTNINYRKYNQYQNGIGRNVYPKQNQEPSNAQINKDKENRSFPNGTKVAIDYSKGQINISQVLTDFRSTILAINAPDEVSQEVSLYLNLVDKESKKENPSREIIVSNLKNASRISDNFIASALGKQSNVVENWINTLFLQNINLKSDPNEINPDFQLQFPKKAQERIDEKRAQENKATEENQVENKPQEVTQEVKVVEQKVQDSAQEQIAIKEPDKKPQPQIISNEPVEVESSLELSLANTNADTIKNETITPFTPKTDGDVEARKLLSSIKQIPKTNKGDADKINILNEALGILQNEENSNPNIKAAIHLERGKIFDDYDYVDYALRDYFEATKADEPNLKANAYYKSGNIYDEFNKFNPALDNYLSSVAYSGEANNPKNQTKALTKISSLYSRRYDNENTINYASLALDSAKDTNDLTILADTYSNIAQNYQYIGEDELALDSYKNAIVGYFKKNQSYEDMAYNYEQAALVMRNLGNIAKADNLQKKAILYYQKAQLQDN